MNLPSRVCYVATMLWPALLKRYLLYISALSRICGFSLVVQAFNPCKKLVGDKYVNFKLIYQRILHNTICIFKFYFSKNKQTIFSQGLFVVQWCQSLHYGACTTLCLFRVTAVRITLLFCANKANLSPQFLNFTSIN